ncbi:Folic acid synthesis protein fol1 [Psilocybe cubensis]|uniref:Folic acid synthesis protein fol1 n=1 Tax=Psilocybe cubensis TaxID=181762 RepID=A0ACB8GI50_PSICU|nr:Folic acid synthesis protein fol1 [Psilocybe cubensis]KAH9474740.1 Folic acid synthesis protein fol1 [Psilocybe cubensis]
MEDPSYSQKLHLNRPAGRKNDIIRINDLILLVSLHTGAQWQAETDEPVEQPVTISLSVYHDISSAALTDKLSHSINYVEVTKRIREAGISRPFQSLQDLANHVITSLATLPSLSPHLDGMQIHLVVRQLKAPLHAKSISSNSFAKFMVDGSWVAEKFVHDIEDLVCPAIIGVNVDERLQKQDVVLNLSIYTANHGIGYDNWIDFRSLISMLYEAVSASDFLTLEALTSYIASETLTFLSSRQSPAVSVRIAKPSALPLARSSEVEIYRTAADYPGFEDEAACTTPKVEKIAVAVERHENDAHTVAIALGSNLGDSVRNIEYALRLLETPLEILRHSDVSMDAEPYVNVVDTSFMYESAPMYVTDQPSFINCACMVETNLAPVTLLFLVKEIESIVGRVPSIRNGPRAVDLDIIFYDDDIIDTRSGLKDSKDLQGELVVPHPLVQEREFVLRPLNDMIPEYIHPILKRRVGDLLHAIYDPTLPPMNKVIPFPCSPLPPPTSESTAYPSISSVPKTLTFWNYPSTSSAFQSPSQDASPSKTHVMATLNVTPDSFSDGAKHDALPAAIRYATNSVAAGASIIDVGGYSTRPGAAFVSVEDEISRVHPAIKSMRDVDILTNLASHTLSAASSFEQVIEKVMNVPISVDTFRWEVAEAALNAGANCINDVYAFTGPDSWPLSSASDPGKGHAEIECMEGMKRVARAYAVPVILMHSRGDAGRNKDYSPYEYAGHDGPATLEGVRVELGRKVEKIIKGKGGLRRWFVVVDPGIGFSKSVNGNLEVLKRAADIVADVKVGGLGDIAYLNPLKGYPLLIGASRKSFLGIILAQKSRRGDIDSSRETQPHERGWATAAAVSCAVQQGALIVRVHDVREMMDVVKVAEALWR